MIGFKGLTTLDSRSLARLSAFGAGVEKNLEKVLLVVGSMTRSV